MTGRFLLRLDFLSVNGSTAGLTAVGPKGRFRFIRWDLDGGSITAEFLGNWQVNRRDFEGAPPVVLRMACRGGVLRCSFSRDERHFENVPLAVRLSDLTDKELSLGCMPLPAVGNWVTRVHPPAFLMSGKTSTRCNTLPCKPLILLNVPILRNVLEPGFREDSLTRTFGATISPVHSSLK